MAICKKLEAMLAIRQPKLDALPQTMFSEGFAPTTPLGAPPLYLMGISSYPVEIPDPPVIGCTTIAKLNCPLTWAVDSHIMCCIGISSCQ